jgi:Flp pilus assembly protein TadD
LQLLLATAVMHVSRNQMAPAIDLLRRVIDLAPDHTLALNNLATLLGEQRGGRGEALQHIGRAIAIAGRKAALLDTQGTILLLDGDYKQAISCLEEAVAAGGTDPRYQFHLAAAYQKAGRAHDAREALERSRSLGLDRALLTDSDRRLLSDLEQSLGQTASIN